MMAYRRREGVLSDVLTQAEINELVSMHDQGFTQKAIAEHFEIHRNTVRNILKRYWAKKREQKNEES
jgi:transposase